MCVAALKATNGDPNMAFEYLMSMGAGGEEGMFEEGYEDMGDDGYGEEGEGDGEGDGEAEGVGSNQLFAALA
jgi:hypothetical protein